MIGQTRIQAEIQGIPGRRVNPMAPNAQMSAAEAKRLRKQQKRLNQVKPKETLNAQTKQTD